MVSRGTSQQSSAPYNRRIVLDVIRRAGEISRKEIVDLVSLSPQTVANITQELESIGVIISKRRKVEKSRGQPPIAFALNPKGGMSIGIYLESGHASAAMVNLVGEILAMERAEVDTNDPQLCLQTMLSMIEKLKSSVEMDATIWGIGVSLPGPFDAKELSFVGPTAFEGWKDLSVLDELHERSGYHVFYSVDSVAGALGESLFGAAKNLRSFFYIHFGIGTGGVLVTGHSAYQGANGNATEFGHIPIFPDGKPCYCGNRGCLERYVSLHALSEYYESQGLLAPRTDQLEGLLAESDPVLESWCQQACLHLRNAVCVIENMLDPETIIIGGTAPKAIVEKLLKDARPWLNSVRGGIADPEHRVLLAHHQEESSILGAAVLPIYEMMAPRLDVLHNEDHREAAAEGLLRRNNRPKVGRL
ncbi:ROK family transcriptional regulator [Teredinibacter sp. KSP-S5-2]|uniref:ROK family transcriptional regulator n=1 Tax=Teredinibacter sp. KSP-S5-2 TaxID=3034506 RepID=UPI0029345BEA|nr:ROK family transcriptional regulator [Teredinibacter sp. KSP-S5-2]WNO08760.1 ROK family transcriptional regulator [Teredinibacter sp. KSP-S5-2]